MRATTGLGLAATVALTLAVVTVIKQHRDGDPVLGSAVRHERAVLAELDAAEKQAANPAAAKPPAAKPAQPKP